MIQDYFVEITIKRPKETETELGGTVTTYEDKGTVMGLLERMTAHELYLAQQRGTSDEFIFMTESNIPKTGDIVQIGVITAQLSSSVLIGNRKSVLMGTIKQWRARTHQLETPTNEQPESDPNAED